MDLLSVKLKKYLANQQETQDDTVESELFETIYKEGNGYDSYNAIPRFYKPVVFNDIQDEFRREALNLVIERKPPVNDDDLDTLWALVHGADDPFYLSKYGLRLTYERYLKIRSVSSEYSYVSFLSTELFAKLLKNESRVISGIDLFNYVSKKMSLNEGRASITAQYDAEGRGFLRECDLEEYIEDLIPEIPMLKCLGESFYTYYVCSSVRKFMFFLDPLGTGKVRIQDMLTSFVMEELKNLVNLQMSKEDMEDNWFSALNSLKLYEQFQSLDYDCNGLLSKEELSRYTGGSLTNSFLNRLFQEVVFHGEEMDYKSYLDFVLALRHKDEPRSAHYFFPIFDIRKKGYLDEFSLNYFFKDLHRRLEERGGILFDFQTLCSAIFDLIKPVDRNKITLQDVINTEASSALLAVAGFNEYWNQDRIFIEDDDVM